MKQERPTITLSKDVSRFFLILTVFFGLYIRLFPLVAADFPLVDGGMFYTMIRDLQTAHFTLPAFTTYNRAEIPFAYPPLPFYLAGAINSFAGIPLLDLIKWLPVFSNILTIPFFYFYIRQVSDSETKAALATLIFVLTPNSYWWNIVGGGLTRSTGALFFILTAISARQMYRGGKKIWIAASIFSGAFVVLSHPAWALQSVIIFLLSWLFWGRNRQGAINSISVGMGILLVTSPWWFTVIQQHGAGIFLRAGQVTHSRWLSWTILFALSFTGEYTPVIAVFCLVGLFIHLARRDYFFPLWALLCLIADPRGGIPASVFPFAMLAAGAIADGIAPQLVSLSMEDRRPENWIHALNSRTGKLFFGFFIILFLYNAYSVSETLSHQFLGTEEIKAIEWVKTNTDAADRFLILDEQGNPLLSPLTEWFPALSERRSIATIQGTEWLEGDRHYNQQYSVVTSLHQCLYEDVGCLYALAEKTESYKFIIISSRTSVPLCISLENHADFKLVYSSATIKIFHTQVGKKDG